MRTFVLSSALLAGFLLACGGQETDPSEETRGIGCEQSPVSSPDERLSFAGVSTAQFTLTGQTCGVPLHFEILSQIPGYDDDPAIADFSIDECASMPCDLAIDLPATFTVRYVNRDQSNDDSASIRVESGEGTVVAVSLSAL